MRTKQTISDHTVMWPLKPNATVLDVGSRNYGFSNACARLGARVWAIEPDTDVAQPMYSEIELIPGALVARGNTGTKQLIKWSSGEGNHLTDFHGEHPQDATLQETPSYSIDEIMVLAGVDFWDVVKLDCEGAEYEILLDWPGPIAEQITVEFHDFCGANPGGAKVHEQIIAHLSQWYDIVQHEPDVRYYTTLPNYWDSLFVLKGGVRA